MSTPFWIILFNKERVKNPLTGKELLWQGKTGGFLPADGEVAACLTFKGQEDRLK